MRAAAGLGRLSRGRGSGVRGRRGTLDLSRPRGAARMTREASPKARSVLSQTEKGCFSQRRHRVGMTSQNVRRRRSLGWGGAGPPPPFPAARRCSVILSPPQRGHPASLPTQREKEPQPRPGLCICTTGQWGAVQEPPEKAPCLMCICAWACFSGERIRNFHPIPKAFLCQKGTKTCFPEQRVFYAGKWCAEGQRASSRPGARSTLH